MHNITRDAAALINIKCCLSHFQVAQPHAVCRIKENTHLEVDFCEVVGVCVCVGGEGFGTEGCLLMLQHLEGDVVALEACVVRQSSEAAPPPPSSPPRPPHGQNPCCSEKTVGLARNWDNVTMMKHFTAN